MRPALKIRLVLSLALIMVLLPLVPSYSFGATHRTATYGLWRGLVNGGLPAEIPVGTWVLFSARWGTVGYPNEEDGLQYLLQFLERTSLEAWLDGKPIPLEQVPIQGPFSCIEMWPEYPETTGYSCYLGGYTYLSHPLPKGEHTTTLVWTFIETWETDGWLGVGGLLGETEPIGIAGDVVVMTHTFQVVTPNHK